MQVAGEDVTFVFSCQVAGKKPVKGEAQPLPSASAPQAVASAAAAPATTTAAASARAPAVADPPKKGNPDGPKPKQLQTGL